MKRLDSLLLAGAGVLIVHQIAYTLSALFGIESSVTHGHMAIAWFVGSLALLAGLATAVVTSLKRRNHDAGHVVTVAATIGLGYFAMEWLERSIDGYGATALFSEPVFWVGLALAPLVALALHWSVQSVVEFAVVHLSKGPRTWVASRPPIGRAPVLAVLPTSRRLSTVVSRRGPPVC